MRRTRRRRPRPRHHDPRQDARATLGNPSGDGCKAGRVVLGYATVHRFGRTNKQMMATAEAVKGSTSGVAVMAGNSRSHDAVKESALEEASSLSDPLTGDCWDFTLWSLRDSGDRAGHAHSAAASGPRNRPSG